MIEIKEMAIDAIDAEIRSFKEEHGLEDHQNHLKTQKESADKEMMNELKKINKKCNDAT